MTEIWKFAALAIVSALLSVVLRKYAAGQAALVSLAGSVGLLMAALAVLSPVMAFVRRISGMAELQPTLLAPVIKTVAVGILTQLTEAFCRDAGQGALAKAVELGGGMLALYALLPLAGSLLELLQTMAGGG